MQRTAPGEQVVVARHSPAWHACGQLCVGIQLADTSHVSTTVGLVGLQRLSPAEHDTATQWSPEFGQDWPDAHATGSDHWVHPDGSDTQVCMRPVLVQRVAKSVHWLVQEEVQEPFEQTLPVGQPPSIIHSLQAVGARTHSLGPEPTHSVAPTVHWSTHGSTQRPPEQTWPPVQAVAVPHA